MARTAVATPLEAPLSPRAVYDAHAPYVHRLARHLGVSERDLDDVVQEVFVVVFRRLEEYDAARGSMTTWLYGICIRVVQNWRRKAYRRREEPRSELADTEVPGSPEQDVVHRRRLARLAEALDTLDDGKRAVFVLYELEQLEMRDVAQALGIPAKTAYSRLYAAREQVLTRLKEKER